MSWPEILGLAVALLVMLIGLLGSVLPVIPSTPLVFLAALVHRLVFPTESVSLLVLGCMFGLMLLSMVMDYIGSVYGARRLGATWKGAVGAIVGGMVGFFFSLPGIILGPFCGALLFEMAGGRDFKESSKAGAGAVLGLLAGALGKFACSLAMIGMFLISYVWNKF